MLRILSLFTGLVLCFCVLSCKSPPNGDHPTTPPAPNGTGAGSPILELPEPSVGDPSRFKITELSLTDHKLLKLKDNITFTSLKNIPVEEVTMSIKSHCIIHEKKVIIKEYQRQLTKEIPLIEILPQKVLLYQGTNTPSCGFSFKATHKSGSAHHFELPQLPIKDYQKSHSLEINQAGIRHTTPFSNVFIENLSQYYLNKKNNKVSYLKLICDDFELPLEVFEQEQFIPLSAFAYDSLPEETKTLIQEEKPVQICRILGYDKKPLAEEETAPAPILTSTGAFFKLVHPTKPLVVYKKPHLESFSRTDIYFEQINQYLGEPINFKRVVRNIKRHKNHDLLYSVVIRNNRSYPVPILIKNNKEEPQANRADHSSDQPPALSETSKEPNLTKAYTLYFIDGYGRWTMYKTSLVQYAVRQNLQNGKSLKKTAKGEVILLNPSGELELSVLLKTAPGICQRELAPTGREIEDLRWLSTLFEYPDLNLFELAMSDTETIPLEWNTVRKLKTTTFADSPFLTIFSKNNFRTNKDLNRKDRLWFLESDCFHEPDPDLYNQAFISLVSTPKSSSKLYRKWSAHWQELHTLDSRAYSRSHASVVRAFRD